MEKDILLFIFVAMPIAVYFGVKIELMRRKRKYRENETGIVEKYQDNIFSLEQKRKEKLEAHPNRDQEKEAA